MLNIRIEKAEVLKAKPADESALGFGKIFTDHMALIDWDADQGWHDARIVPFQRISMHPASTCLHYGSEIFEGLKAYRTAEGDIQLFRPDCNIDRLNKAADRLCLPQIPYELALAGIVELVKLEQDWVPYEKDTSLYIRPFMIGVDAALGVHSSHHVQ